MIYYCANFIFFVVKFSFKDLNYDLVILSEFKLSMKIKILEIYQYLFYISYQ